MGFREINLMGVAEKRARLGAREFIQRSLAGQFRGRWL
jgi:hypothetical protein